MKIIPFDEVDPFEWDAFVNSCSSAWLFHRAKWIAIEREFFFGEESLSFAILRGAEVVAIQPLFITKLGLGSWSETLIHSGIHRHTGLALADSLDIGEVNACRSLAMNHIHGLAEKYRATRIQLNIQNLAPNHRGERRDEIPFWVTDYNYFLGLGFGPNGLLPGPGVSTCCADQIVELFKDEDELFAALDSSCRRAIRKASNHGLSFGSDTDNQVASYYELALLSAKRTGEALPSVSYYEKIYDFFSKTGHCQILFVRIAEKKIAAIFLLIDKGAVHFLGGVSDPNFLPFRVNDFLHWSSIVWAKNKGYCSYRLGPIFPELPANWPVSKVSRFKGKFGGRSVPIIQGSCFIQPQKYQGSARQLIEALTTEVVLRT